MRGQNDAEAVITFRAEDEASEQIREIREQSEEASKGFDGLSRGMVGTALGFLGLSFGAKELVDNFQDVARSNASVEFSLALLGPGAVKAHDEMSDEFRGIAEDVAATEREVSEAFTIIIQNSGGIAPSIGELGGAFDLARLKGITFEDAAARIGMALQGNLEPLEELLDASGRKSIVSLARVLQDAAKHADDAVTPIDRLTAKLREFADSLVDIANEEEPTVFEKMLNAISPLTPAFRALADAMGLFNDEADKTFGIEAFQTGGISDEQRSFLSSATAAGIIPDVSNLTPVTPITLNIGSVDSDSRLNELVRRIEEIIRNNNRNGTNVSDQ